MCVRGRIGGLGWRGWRAGQAWFGRHPIRREGLSIREHVFVIGHGVGVQPGLVGVGTAHALWRRSGRRVVPGTEVAKDLLELVSVLTIYTFAEPSHTCSPPASPLALLPGRPTAHGAPSTLPRQTPVATLRPCNSIRDHLVRVGAGLNDGVRYKKNGGNPCG